MHPRGSLYAYALAQTFAHFATIDAIFDVFVLAEGDFFAYFCPFLNLT